MFKDTTFKITKIFLLMCTVPFLDFYPFSGLNAAKEDDFDLFINLFHINAAENNLKLEVLQKIIKSVLFENPTHFFF